MLRLTELKLPLDHTPADLEAAMLARLKLTRAEIQQFNVFRRGYDARKKSDIFLVYTLDIETAPQIEVALFKRFARHCRRVCKSCPACARCAGPSQIV